MSNLKDEVDLNVQYLRDGIVIVVFTQESDNGRKVSFNSVIDFIISHGKVIHLLICHLDGESGQPQFIILRY